MHWATSMGILSDLQYRGQLGHIALCANAGNALFGWWELGSAIVGDLPDLQTAKQSPLA